MKLIDKKAAEYCETIKVDKDYCLDLTARYCDNEGRPFTPLTIYEAGWRACREEMTKQQEFIVSIGDMKYFGEQEVE